jgi:hypothetical protein
MNQSDRLRVLLIILLLPIWVCATSASAQQRRQSDRELAGLRGAVQIVREYRTFSAVKLTPIEVAKLLKLPAYRTFTYNTTGDLIEETNLYGLNYTYSYRADGQRLKTAHGDKSPGSGMPLPDYVAERYASDYDKAGRKTQTITYLRDGSTPWFRQTFEYDANDRIRTLTHYRREADGKLVLGHTITYTYREGDEVEILWRDAAGALMDKFSYSNYKHDANGNWTERSEARHQVYDPAQPKEQWGTIYRVITYY